MIQKSPIADVTTLQYLRELTRLGVVWVQLVPGEKISTRGWDHFLHLHDQPEEDRFRMALAWLRKGYGLGFLPRGDVWVIDCDSPDTIRRVEAYLRRRKIRAVRLNTPSGGAHFYFLYPEGFDFEKLKNHVCHPKENGEKVPWDFKLGHRTMLVAPGTVKPSGVYAPATDWGALSEVDPRDLAPDLEIYKHQPPFLVNERDFNSRVIAAQNYIKFEAPVSVKGSGSRKALFQVAAHLVAYHQLDPALAYNKLTTSQGGVPSWNSRCKAADGSPRPWSSAELIHALNDAVDAVPMYGVYQYEQREHRAGIEGDFRRFLNLANDAQAEHSFITANDLQRSFSEFSGRPAAELSGKLFGDWVSAAIRDGTLPVERCLKTRRRIIAYKGINPVLLHQKITEELQWEIDRLITA